MIPYAAASIIGILLTGFVLLARRKRRRVADWTWRYWHHAADLEPTKGITPEAIRTYCTLRGGERGVDPRSLADRMLCDEAQWADFLDWLSREHQPKWSTSPPVPGGGPTSIPPGNSRGERVGA